MSSGISGGYPGTPNTAILKRNTDVRAKLKGGVLPQELAELSGETEVLPPIVQTHQGGDDVYHSIATGGGGFGDPLERPPEHVLDDLGSGAVSVAHAAGAYGVVAVERDGEFALDSAATESARDDIRAARRGATARRKA